MTKLNELDVVTIIDYMTFSGKKGTIVYCYQDGENYEVEIDGICLTINKKHLIKDTRVSYTLETLPIEIAQKLELEVMNSYIVISIYDEWIERYSQTYGVFTSIEKVIETIKKDHDVQILHINERIYLYRKNTRVIDKRLSYLIVKNPIDEKIKIDINDEIVRTSNNYKEVEN